MGFNMQVKSQLFAKGLQKLVLNSAFNKTKLLNNETADTNSKTNKDDKKQNASVFDNKFTRTVKSTSAYKELSSDEANFAIDLIKSYQDGYKNSVISNSFNAGVNVSNPFSQAVSGSSNTGWENVQAVKLTGSESLEELRQGKSDTEDKLEKAEKAVTENEAVENAKKSEDNAKAQYEKAISDFVQQKEAQIQAKNAEKTMTESKIKYQKTVISNTEHSISEKSQEIANQEAKLAKHEKTKPSIKNYQKEEVQEDGTVRVYTDFQAYMQDMKKWKKEKQKIENKIEMLKEAKKELEEKLKEQKRTLNELNDKNSKIKKEIQELKEEKAQKNSQEILSAKENYDKKQRERKEITDRATTLQTKARFIFTEDLDTYVNAITGKEEEDEKLIA